MMIALSTATPNSAMKPTADDTFSVMPRRCSAISPPSVASGTAERISAGCRRFLNSANSSTNISASTIGKITASRACARCWFSNWPPQAIW